MVSQKMHLKKVIFWTKKKVTCDTHSSFNLPIFVLFNKTENRQSSKKYSECKCIALHNWCPKTMFNRRAYFGFIK
jgi:hypothetical protein